MADDDPDRSPPEAPPPGATADRGADGAQDAGDRDVTGGGESWRVYDLDRTIAFSDAVIAIAITLLVLTLEPPDLAGEVSVGRLLDALWDQASKFFVFVVSFFVIARFWILHHRFCGRLETMDGRLIGLNLLFLALIALVPYPTDLYGDYNSNPLALTALAVVIAAASAMSMLMLAYARTRGLMTAEGEARTPRPSARWAIVPAAFLLPVPIAFIFSAEWAPVVWFLFGIVRSRAGSRWPTESVALNDRPQRSRDPGRRDE